MPFQETPIVDDALRHVAELLPVSWRFDERRKVGIKDQQLDALVDLIGPNGDRARFVVEAKRSGAVSNPHLLSMLREQARHVDLPMLFISEYIGLSLRAALTAEGISFADATGWVRVISENPLIVLTAQGAERSPRTRADAAVTRLDGLAASRTIRALSHARLPIGVRALATLAGVSPGSASKLLVTLASEGIVDRTERGGVFAVRRRALIRRWALDYSFAKSNHAVGYYIAPRGLDRILPNLAERGRAVVTGSVAARRLLPDQVTSVVPLRLLALYSGDPIALSHDLGLIVAEPVTANVVIAAPQDRGILPGPDDLSPLVAPAALVLVDLLTLPGRSDAEAEQLMEALAASDIEWKE